LEHTYKYKRTLTACARLHFFAHAHIQSSARHTTHTQTGTGERIAAANATTYCGGILKFFGLSTHASENAVRN